MEVDGSQHALNSAYDDERTQWLNHNGFRVLRFWNNEVLESIESVLDVILRELNREEI